MTLLDQLHRFMTPVYRRLNALLSKGIVKSASDGSKIQVLKVALGAGELRDGLERLQPYGLTSVPEAGAEAVVAFIGGNRDNGVVVVVDDSRERKTGLSVGDVCLYRKGGPFIQLKDNNVIEIHAKNVNVTLDSGGQLNVANGNLTVDA